MELLLQSLALSLIVQVIFFAFAAWKKTDVVTDLSYGLTFIILILHAYLFNSQQQLYQLLVVLMVVLWGVRISGYLFWRILQIKKDRRFDGIRENFMSFASFWLLQAVSVWVISLPALSAVMLGESNPHIDLMPVGLIIWASGLLIETVADIQKSIFKSKASNKGKWTDVGLWSKSRHPNYFGEMLVWWGIYIYCLLSLSGWMHLVVIGPLLITYLLRFGTGVPPLEEQHKKKYGKMSGYKDYVKRTRLLIPV